jgi:hypothetical protein
MSTSDERLEIFDFASADVWLVAWLDAWVPHVRPALRANVGLSISLTRSVLENAPLQSRHIERSSFSDGHHRHHAGLNRIAHDQVGGIRHATGHIQADH